jgi:hypothetical protein
MLYFHFNDLNYLQSTVIALAVVIHNLGIEGFAGTIEEKV